MTAVIFTTNTGSPIGELLGIRANYDGETDTLTVDNAVVGLGGDDSIDSTFLPIDIGGQLFSFTITLDGGDGNDSVFGSNATDILIGGAGNDAIAGISGSTMSGGADIDTLNLSTPTFAAALIVNYAAQAAAAVTLSDGSTISGFERFFIQSGAGNDVLDLSGDANALDSNFASFDGDDTLRVNAATQGGIVFNSGLGSDRIVADLSALASTVQLISLSPVGPGGSLIAAGLTVGSNDVERFEVTTGSGNDDLSGGGFADILAGGAGNDTLDGGGGGDTLDGGAGAGDTTDYSAATGTGVTVNLGILAAQTISATEGSDTLSGIENITGSAQNDILTGNNAANTLSGGAGNDTLTGGHGADTALGGNGNDSIYDGLNTDTVQGGADNDTFFLHADSVADTVNGDGGIDTINLGFAVTPTTVTFGATAFAGTIVGGGLGLNSFSGIERIVGGNFVDTINGGIDAEILFGRNGNDVINGNGGNDVLLGEANNDTLNGGANVDTVSGGDGDDEVAGGANNDFLSGNAGADDFNYAAVTDSGPAAANRDRIFDFVHLVDDIDVSAIDAMAGTAGNNAFTNFIGAAAFSAEGQIRAFQSGAHTIVEFNTLGAGGAEMSIQLDIFTAATLTIDDFIA